MAPILRDFWAFLRVRKRYWLLPALLVGGMLAALALFSESSPVAPFVYTIF